MKKKLEAELISIAHRILKLKNKSELVQLHLETQKLYEKLSVLRFLEEQFDEVRPTIGRAEVEAKLEMTDIEKPVLAEIPSEPLRMTEKEFVPIAVFMPEEVSEDRGAEDEEIEKSTDQTKTSLKEDEFVPVAVFMPEEVTEDRGPEDEEIEVKTEQTKPFVTEAKKEKEDEFVPVSVFMPQEVTEDRGSEDEEIEEKHGEIREEVPMASIPQGEKVETPEVPPPHIPEMSEIEKILARLQTQKTEPAPEQEDVIIRHVLPMDEIEEEIEEEESEEPVSEIPSHEEVKSGPKEISFADLLGHDFSEPVFERISDIKSNTVETPVFEKSPVDFSSEPAISKETLEHIPYFKADSPKTDHAQESHPKTITFGLNDKIGFEKHLFGGSSEEMNRVVSQLGSFNTFEEARDFIEDMVKPDYSNWVGKEDYEQRFLEIIERRFA